MMNPFIFEIARQRHEETIERAETNYRHHYAELAPAVSGMRARIALSLVRLAALVQPELRFEVRRRSATPVAA
jgi:hypothetical protein